MLPELRFDTTPSNLVDEGSILMLQQQKAANHIDDVLCLPSFDQPISIGFLLPIAVWQINNESVRSD